MNKSSRSAPPTIAITGMGMVTSLGLDVETSCAAARAGVVRPVDLDYFPVQSPEDGEVSGLVGHPVSLITEGFEGDARLLRLAQAGLTDLSRHTMHVSFPRRRTGFYLSFPDRRRIHTGFNLIPDEEERQAKAKEAGEDAEGPPDADKILRLLQGAACMSGWPGEVNLRHFSISGHTGTAEAFLSAMNDIHKGEIEIAIVGGIDSLLDEDTLSWLANTGRLKTPGVAAGLQPGEAGAFLLLEPMESASKRGGKIFAAVKQAKLGMESASLLSGEISVGSCLSEMLHELSCRHKQIDDRALWVISDQNGEFYRACEWGHAVTRIIARSKAQLNIDLWYTADSFGDTGAASGAVASCLAIAAFERNYAPNHNAFIVSSAEGSSRSAIVIENMENSI